MAYAFVPMTQEHARAILGWQYGAPFSLYNHDPRELETDLRVFLDPSNAYYSILEDHGKLVGYCCFGIEAQVPGGVYESNNTLDIGAGMLPDLTGTGLAPHFLNSILDWASAKFSPKHFRVTVASFNRTVMRLCTEAGFKPEQTFTGRRAGDERKFVQMVKGAR